eukprot:PhM_4_TR12909/c0_g1_i1/m.105989/K03144/TFIIH4, GTF2H4, TFB2; transcription initiation factor TFIIH subunit 4
MISLVVQRQKRSREEVDDLINNSSHTNAAAARTCWSLLASSNNNKSTNNHTATSNCDQVLRNVLSNIEPDVSQYLRALCCVSTKSTASLLPDSIKLCPKKVKLDYEKLYAEGRKRFETTLQWLLRDRDCDENVVKAPSENIVKVLEFCGYVKQAPAYAVTGHGIHYCLASFPEQVSIVIAACVRYVQQLCCKDNTRAADELVDFALTLPQHDAGAFYYMQKEVSHQNLILLLVSFGLMYKASAPDKSGTLYTVFPAVRNVLLLSNPTKTTKFANDLNVIVETNFRVYAYCASSGDKCELYRRILTQFCDVLTTIQNHGTTTLIVAMLTHESTTRAFRTGVSAQDVISFLTSNLHESQTRQGLPVTVVEQLQLWEEESRRVSVYTLGGEESNLIVSSNGNNTTYSQWSYVMLEFESLSERQQCLQSREFLKGCVLLSDVSPLKVLVARKL